MEGYWSSGSLRGGLLHLANSFTHLCMCKCRCMWIWVWILKGASKTPTRQKKSPNCADDAPVRGACARSVMHSEPFACWSCSTDAANAGSWSYKYCPHHGFSAFCYRLQQMVRLQQPPTGQHHEHHEAFLGPYPRYIEVSVRNEGPIVLMMLARKKLPQSLRSRGKNAQKRIPKTA